MEEQAVAPRPSEIPRPVTRLPVPVPVPGTLKSSAIPAPPASQAAPVQADINGGPLKNPRLRPSASMGQIGSLARKKSQGPDAAAQSSQTLRRPKRVPSYQQALDGRQGRLGASLFSKPTSLAPLIVQQTTSLDGPLLNSPTIVPVSPVASSTLPYNDRNTVDQDRDRDQSDSRPTSSSANESSAMSPEVQNPRMSKPPRPSLSERTIDTLSQLPSSPALSKRPSFFFDTLGTVRSSPSRPSSSGSRPGSRDGNGYGNSYGNSNLFSKPSRQNAMNRPGSSSGAEDNGAKPTPKSSSVNTWRLPLSPIDGTPVESKTAKRQSLQSPQLIRTPSRTAASKLQEPKKYTAISPERPDATVNTVRQQQKTRPTRPSLNTSLRRQASAQFPQKSAADPRIGSGASAPPTPTLASKNSSTALREQIAKLKLAKRAAVPAATEQGGSGNQSPAISVLNQRLNQARTSGRLNIAAMALKSIPAEILQMYDLKSKIISAGGGSWAESVDLTRFVAADNEIEVIDGSIFPDSPLPPPPKKMMMHGYDNNNDNDEDDEGSGNLFAGLETLDLHGNSLVGIPIGLRRLSLLTSLNLSHNRLTNDSLDIISQITSLRDLKLSGNLFYGPMSTSMSNLHNVEILDLHANSFESLPADISNMARLRILDVSENCLASLDFSELSKLPHLTEMLARKNKLSGVLVQDGVSSLHALRLLDVSINRLTHLVSPGTVVFLPSLYQLTLSMNRIQCLPSVGSWTSLQTLAADENSISAIPDGFAALQKLRHADFYANDIQILPPEIARMDQLVLLRVAGNPLRDRQFASATTEDIKEALGNRLEPPPPYEEEVALMSTNLLEKPLMHATSSNGATKMNMNTETDTDSGVKNIAISSSSLPDRDDDSSRSDLDDFATPPTSAHGSPSRSRASTVATAEQQQLWLVKPAGILDRSHSESTTLEPTICAKIVTQGHHQGGISQVVSQVMLHHNKFNSVPAEGLSHFAATMTSLSIANNELARDTYLSTSLELPCLRELNLCNNQLASLTPLVSFLLAQKLEKVDVSMNRITSIPTALRTSFPDLTVLLACNNKINELDPESIQGMRIVDVSNNDIEALNPRIGLLAPIGGARGLERLEAQGNRFRIPKWDILQKGTGATLRWLRGRIPEAELADWRAARGGDGDVSADEVD